MINISIFVKKVTVYLEYKKYLHYFIEYRLCNPPFATVDVKMFEDVKKIF